MGDKLGSKMSLVIIGIVFEAGPVMQVASQGTTAVMFVGRAIGGPVSLQTLQPTILT
jgi:hypothetical protein